MQLLQDDEPFLRSVAGLEAVRMTALSNAITSTEMCGVTARGAVLCWDFLRGFAGSGAFAWPVETFAGAARTIASGQHHACVIADGGGVWCWGINTHGERGIGTQTDVDGPVRALAVSEAKQITCSADHCCALDKEGSVWCWGGNNEGELGPPLEGPARAQPIPTKVAGLNDAVEVATGHAMTCTRRRDASTWCVGAGEGLRKLELPAEQPSKVHR